MFAGTGSASALAREGSPGFGVARSTDGGDTWTVLGASTFAGRRINNIVPTALHRGKIVLAATLLDGGGVFRSTDLGSSFTRLSGDGTSGLPDQGVSSRSPIPATQGDSMQLCRPCLLLLPAAKGCIGAMMAV